MQNLHHLAVFNAVASTGSISAGAALLMVSQPGITKQIRSMERAMKVRLFDRHPRGVRLTPAGTLLAGYTRRIFSLLAEADVALADLSSLKRGSLAIGAGPTVGVYLLPAVMVRFRREYPDILLKVETEGPDLLRQRLLDGMIELAFSESPILSPELVSKKAFHDLLVPVVFRSHRLAASTSVTPATFCREPFITRQVESDAGSLVERTLAARGLTVSPVLTVASTEAMKQAVIAGLGVAVISRLAIQTELAAGLLVELKVKGLRIKYPIHQVSLKDRTMSKAAVRFQQMMREAH
jgi:DNA-binding transcriptional LysR family regulator